MAKIQKLGFWFFCLKFKKYGLSMNTVSSIAKNSMAMLSSEVLTKLITFSLTIILARYLGVLAFGQFSYLFALVMLFEVMADFGLDNLMIREISQDKQKTKNLLSSVLTLKIITGFISFCALFMFVFFFRKQDILIRSALLAGLAVFFHSLANTFNSVFTAEERLDLKALFNIVAKLFLLVLIIITIKLNFGLFVVFGAFLSAEILRTIIGLYGCYKNFSVVALNFNLKTIKCLVKTTSSFALISIISLIYFKIDIIMLSILKSDQAVGWYNAAYGLFAALLFIPESYCASIFPVLSRYAISDKEKLSFSWSRSVKYLIMVSVPIVVSVFILNQRIITLFYSEAYIPSAACLKILIFTIPWVFVNAINMRLLFACNQQKPATVVALISLLLNVVFNFILIPKFSYLGASWATLIVEIINVSIYFVLVSKILGLKLKEFVILAKIIFASVLMGVFIEFFKTSYLLFIILGATALYLFFIFKLHIIDKKDKELFGQIKFKF
ncbi:MAG: flippase [Candidatus Omnitrophota bacterium]